MHLLTTPRLTGRRLTGRDRPFFLQLHQHPQVMAFIADPLTEQQILTRFRQRLKPWNTDSRHWLCLLLTERTSAQPVGLTGFCLREPGIAEAGFMFSPEAQGKGYASESLNALTAEYFNRGYGHRIFTRVSAENHACIRLMQRCGFQQEGRLRQCFFLHRQWQDDLLFSRLASDPVSGR